MCYLSLNVYVLSVFWLQMIFFLNISINYINKILVNVLWVNFDCTLIDSFHFLIQFIHSCPVSLQNNILKVQTTLEM